MSGVDDAYRCWEYQCSTVPANTSSAIPSAPQTAIRAILQLPENLALEAVVVVVVVVMVVTTAVTMVVGVIFSMLFVTRRGA